MTKYIFILILLLSSLTISFSQSIKLSDSLKGEHVDTLSKVNKKIDNSILEKQNLQLNFAENKTTYFTEWENGFISGLIATLIGFFLTMIWDIYKNRRDKIEKDQIIKKLIHDTLNENLVYIDKINQVLTQEIAALVQQQSVVTNITTLKNDYWDLIKFNIPKDHLKDNNLLKKLQDISSLTKSINENIDSREMYRLNNGAMSNFETRLQHYDDLILSENTKLINHIKDYQATN